MLCDECNSLDLRKVFAPDRKESEPIFITERSIGHFRKNLQCPFCRLVIQSVPASMTQLGSHTTCRLRRELSAQIYERGPAFYWKKGPSSFYQVRGSIHPAGFLDLPRDLGSGVTNEVLEERRQRRKLEFIIRPMSLSDSPLGVFVQARPICEDQIDVNLLKRWMTLCPQQHKDMERTTPVERDIDLYVIDIKNKQLVSLLEGKRYAALSYVWGPPSTPQLRWTKDTAGQLFSPGALDAASSEIPTTIRDAMRLCAALDLQYLWVDAICIPQDDSRAKSRTIAVMDAVYQNAFITFVAAAGRDSWAGLPGVQPQSRHIVKHVEEIRGLKLTNACMDFSDSIGDSMWYRRGWTFQEYLLSSRLLVFTEYQAFFACDQALWFEDWSMETMPDARVQIGGGLQDWREVFKNPAQTAQLNFEYVIRQLSSRQFTYDHDILDAFAGSERWFNRSQGWLFWQGMPVESFDAALLFIGTYDCPCREGFPTWSWASWKTDKNPWLQPSLRILTDWSSTLTEVEWMRWTPDESGRYRYEALKNSAICKQSTDDLENASAESFGDQAEIYTPASDMKAAAGRRYSITYSQGFAKDLVDKCTNDANVAARLARERSLWRVPLSRRAATPDPPKCLSKPDLDRLLVFQTSCTVLEVRFVEAVSNRDDPTEYVHEARLKDQLHPPPEHVDESGGWNISFRLLWKVDGIKDIELAVIARDAWRNKPWDSPLETLVIRTDERAISQRVERGPRIPDATWAATKPVWRTVFLL